MSSPSNYFECRWHASGQLLAAYLAAQTLALIAICLLSVPVWARVLGAVLCLLQAAWALQQHQQGEPLYGLPTGMDPLEGWIVLSTAPGR